MIFLLLSLQIKCINVNGSQRVCESAAWVALLLFVKRRSKTARRDVMCSTVAIRKQIVSICFNIRAQTKKIHSSFLGVNVRISWGEKLGSTENNEINTTQTPRRKRGNCASTAGCSHTQSD